MLLEKPLERADETYVDWVLGLEDPRALLATYARARSLTALLLLLSSPLLVAFLLWEGSDLGLALLILPPALLAFFFAYFNRTVRVLKVALRLAGRTDTEVAHGR